MAQEHSWTKERREAEERMKYQDALERTAGPSNPRKAIRVRHQEPTYDEEKNQEPIRSQRKRYRSDTEEDLDPPSIMYQRATSDGRRPPNPSGEYFDEPCSKCISRRVECEKDSQAAACVRCYIGKNKCDYGSRYLLGDVKPKRVKGQGRGKWKGKGKMIEKDDIESEDDDEMPRKIDYPRRATKRIRSSAYVDDSDEVMASGFDTAVHPPTSRSPSPRPRREAAKRADVALSIAVKTLNRMEENYQRRSQSKYRSK